MTEKRFANHLIVAVAVVMRDAALVPQKEISFLPGKGPLRQFGQV